MVKPNKEHWKAVERAVGYIGDRTLPSSDILETKEPMTIYSCRLGLCQ